MAVSITVGDVKVFVPGAEDGQVSALITGAVARATEIAPCLASDDFDKEDAAKAIIVEAIVRRLEAGAGSLSLQQAGPFQQAIDTRTSPRTLFWPAEIVELQSLCAAAQQGVGGGALPEGRFGDPVDLPRAPGAEWHFG